MMVKKKTINFIKDYIKKEGFELISKKYKNCLSHIYIKCPDNHIYKTNWNKFKNGRRCNICAKTKRKNIIEIKKYIENCGYKLLSNNYINCNTKLKILCIKGHIYTSTWNKFYSGYRCSVCSGNYKKSFNYIKHYIEKFGYTVITKESEYKNSKTIIKTICPNNHNYNIRWNDFYRGIRCSTCAGTKKKSFNFIKQSIENVGFRLISTEYNNSMDKLKVMCPKGHIFYPTWHNFNRGSRCPMCSNRISKTSQIWLDELNIDGKYREKYIKTSNGYIYFADACVGNVVYEYFGNFWHGNPDSYNPIDINPITKTSFGYLYFKTIFKILQLKKDGYVVIYKWGE